ncbi:unnamed protein product [Camellia sinensis]
MDGTTFQIGRKKLKLKRNDFKLIFGIACRQKKMHLVYGRKDDIDLVKRRKIRENRMTSASIQKLITKLLRSKKKEDREDVVRLVCLLICLLLLNLGTGTTIGWGFIKYLEDIDKIKSYDWCDVAKQQLTKSIERNINQIDKVSGCVMVILYWICEHTSTIKSNAKNAISRFAKWNITCLGQKLASSSLQELKDIVPDQDLTGIVIDAYAEHLIAQKQGTTSFVFILSCHHLFTTKDEEARQRMLNKMMPEAMKARYILFPIHQNFHWTILVLDIEEATWKFYNSMRPRGTMTKDPHFNAANEV